MRKKRGRIGGRKLLAYVLIVCGLAVLAYPAGTWLLTKWYQGNLEEELSAANPQWSPDTDLDFSSNGDGSAYTFEDGALTASEKGDLRTAAQVGEREEALRARARGFSRSVSGDQGTALGRMEIPGIGLEVIVVEGTTDGALRRGPGHWPETPFPGLGGNMVISGHRTTYGGPFLRLDRLEEGEVIRMLLPYAAVEYRVTEKLIVSPDEVNVVSQRGREELSLTTCHPIYSARQRLIVRAEMTALKLTQVNAGNESSLLPQDLRP